MDRTTKITRNLGGDRLGSGNKNNVQLHKYNRSTHDLSKAWRSSMNVGTLVPFMKLLALDGENFSIDLNNIVRTMPSLGPLYGSYKMQLDVFTAPLRLYNGLLHNNMVNIGKNMEKVKLPKVILSAIVKSRTDNNYDIEKQISKSSLVNYLGLNGIGDIDWTSIADPEYAIEREFQCVPVLAYYEIYKNYYANKQEEKGVIIKADPKFTQSYCSELLMSNNWQEREVNLEENSTPPTGIALIAGQKYQKISDRNAHTTYPIVFARNYFGMKNWQGTVNYNTIYIVYYDSLTDTYNKELATSMYTNVEFTNGGNILCTGLISTYDLPNYFIEGIIFTYENVYLENENINLQTFDLENIDQMRIDILQDTGLNNQYYINAANYEPYKTIWDVDKKGNTLNKYSQNGLAIKTYQSDILQNWLNTEWIDGVSGVNQITKVDTSSGDFEINALLLAYKVYNLFNRVYVSGGSYEDWREAVWSVEVSRRAESPIYQGGMSCEIAFSEVVSNSATEDQPLGSLAGKGGEHARKGGKIEIRVDEPSYIIGIVSITPRVDYSQGNDFDICEVNTMDDLHKPALDGIGFQDLLQERMAFWGTYFDPLTGKWIKLAAGKTPAWLDYQTAVNETHGDFADENKCMFMTLNRRYEYFQGADYRKGNMGIKDLTTYIDPRKYNYIFAEGNIKSQNFWVQIGAKIKARRVMSATILPNL